MRELRLLDLRIILETEEHDYDDMCNLAESITNLGFWIVPIVVEYSTFAIMDGHHRFNAAKKLGLKESHAFLWITKEVELPCCHGGLKLTSL